MRSQLAFTLLVTAPLLSRRARRSALGAPRSRSRYNFFDDFKDEVDFNEEVNAAPYRKGLPKGWRTHARLLGAQTLTMR